jgi:uncharacterized protein DUF1883
MSGDFVKYDLGHVDAGSVVEVTLAHRANVLLLDSQNFQRYRNGQSHDYYGGEALRSPVRLQVPGAGHWLVVVNLGGAAGSIRSSVRVLSNA